ncbi:MAG: response regulator [Flavobacterium sp.]|nr:response regulator [Flavobacterium sp.]
MLKDSKSYNIIVVEDNPGDLVLLESYLEETIAMPNLRHFSSFNSLKEFLESNLDYNSVDILLLDLSLPDKHGEQLICDVIEMSKNIPIVALTGYSSVDFAIKTLSLGVSDYLLKDDLTPTILYKSIIYNIERNKNLVKLKESEQRYSNIFHLSPQPMLVYDAATLFFLDANDAAIAHYGFSLEEFKKNTLNTISLSAIKDNFHDNEVYNQFFKHRKKDGTLIDVDIRTNSILFNQIDAKVIIVNDITESLLQIKAIQLQNQKLKDIAWTQSHLVRAPLARILGLIEIIEDADQTTTHKEEVLHLVAESAKELDKIVTDIVVKSKQIIP